MRLKEEQIRNVARVFEAFARAIAKRENIKIEYLNDEGETTCYTIDLNLNTETIHFQISPFGNVQLLNNGIPFFQENIKDIQSVTTFRETKLKFSEVNKK